MSKLSDFLDKEKIDPRRVLVASRNIERLRPEDRRVRLARRKVRSGKNVTDADKEVAAQERRSGKPVTQPTMDAALAGGNLSGRAKQRVTDAVNHLLKAKKKSEVAVSDLF